MTSSSPTVPAEVPPGLALLKARQKAAWESGDFGEVARCAEATAGEFMARLPMRPGLRVLDVACGSGNLAMIAGRGGCAVSGIDIASNLVGQARERARREGLKMDLREADAEELPYPDAHFDRVVSMFGVMFAPRADRAVAELLRVCRPGGLIALASWTPEGFNGRMFRTVARHVPPPAGLPSPLLWGDEATIRERFRDGVASVHCQHRLARIRYPFSPAGTVEFFRRYFGPLQRAFALLDPVQQDALRANLEALYETQHTPGTDYTETAAEYLEVRVVRA